MKAEFGMIGLAVMGENLAMNLLLKGIRVAVYDLEPERVVRAFVEGRAKGLPAQGAYSLRELVNSLEKPRKVMMMIRAGNPVDEVIEQLLPMIEPGDILIDGGNSNFLDTIRRTRTVEAHGCHFIGMGVSGGAEGALKGPSLMPGGSKAAWPAVRPILQKIAARVDGDPCCEWVGADGAGHFVKMVHNGIEYGDMQLIAEAYDLMKSGVGMTPDEMSGVFAKWNQGALDSYLIGITGEILAKKDEDGMPLIDKILDAAGQKGTGKWACVEALHEGVPLTMIAEAVFARCLSAEKDERVRASDVLGGPGGRIDGERAAFLADLENAVHAAKIISYAQGFSLLRAAAKTHGWDLNYGGIALMWRGGCIIRSAFLGRIREAFEKTPELENLMMAPYFSEILNEHQAALRLVCAKAVLAGIPVPSLSAALAYFDGYRRDCLPANLLQAQRDYFGAHTYERADAPRGVFFHTDWTGTGSGASSTAYKA